MPEIWVQAEPWDRELVIAALEAGADAVIVSPERVPGVRELGRIKIVAENGDIRWGRDVVLADVAGPEDEEAVVRECKSHRVVVRTPDWKIIPLENLVARTGNLMVEAGGDAEVHTALGILEKGVDGVILTTRDPGRIRSLIRDIKSTGKTLDLTPLTVKSVAPVGMGDRVCVDTCTLMGPGDGTLVGSSSRGFFLMHAESLENPYVSPRPFRVNAGAVHAYVLGAGDRTPYLAELRAGDTITGINSNGETFPLVIGRVKTERRPMLLVEAEAPCGTVSTICQNAETVRMISAETREAVSVVTLAPGDDVLGFTGDGGRHFGRKVTESILER
jgi:3-dehydroquinate synthase II